MASGSEHDDLRAVIIEVSKDKCKYINKDYARLSNKMFDYQCDIRLQVETEVFRAHKDVLSEASDYFSAMFSHNMVEKDQATIEIKGISPRGFHAMMDYVYHGHVTMEPSYVEDVLEAARFFHIEWLMKVCREYLVKRLSIDNYLKVLELADTYFLGDLRSDIFKFVAYKFGELSKKPLFMQLSFELLYELLSGDHYIDANEGHIFRVVCSWLEHAPEERNEHQVTLLSLIRYPLLEIEELESVPEYLLEVSEIRECLEEAKSYQADPSAQCLSNAEQTEVRGSKDSLVLYSADEDASQVTYRIPNVEGFFNTAADTRFMHSVFEFSAVTTLGNFLFASGGYNRGNYSSSPAFYRYNPRNLQWAQLSSMKQPRVSHVLCASKNGLYAVAGIDHVVLDGIDREIILNSVEFYDPVKNLWDFVAELPLGCFSPAACVSANKLYVCGGISADVEDNIPVNYLHVYNPDDDTWLPKARMLFEHQSHGIMEYKQKLYVFGGYTAGEEFASFIANSKNEVYDTETDQWTHLIDSPPNFQHFYNMLALLDDKIYILGGNEELRSLYTYDPEKNEFCGEEVCGEADMQKLVGLKIALPIDIIQVPALE